MSPRRNSTLLYRLAASAWAVDTCVFASANVIEANVLASRTVRLVCATADTTSAAAIRKRSWFRRSSFSRAWALCAAWIIFSLAILNCSRWNSSCLFNSSTCDCFLALYFLRDPSLFTLTRPLNLFSHCLITVIDCFWTYSAPFSSSSAIALFCWWEILLLFHWLQGTTSRCRSLLLVPFCWVPSPFEKAVHSQEKTRC